MNALLKLAVIVMILALINCNETFDLFKETKSSGTKTTLSYDAEYICQSDSKLRKVTQKGSLEATVPCNGAFNSISDWEYNITFRDNNLGTQLLSLKNIRNFVVYKNGNFFYYTAGEITNGICAPGHMETVAIEVNYDRNSCNSKEGVVYVESIRATFVITKGKCKSKCNGNVRTRYNPGVRD